VKRVTGLTLLIIACIIAAVSAGGWIPSFPVLNSSAVILIIVALVILVLLLYRTEIRRGGIKLFRFFLSPLLNDDNEVNGELYRKIEAAEKKMDTTEQALLQFSSAIADYAKHLASHTSAIEGLSQASHELKKSAAEQNRVLGAIMENTVKSNSNRKSTTAAKEMPLKIQQSVSQPEKPAGIKIPPFHRALYKTGKAKPSYKIEKPAAEPEHQVNKNERRPILTGKTKLDVERPAPFSAVPEPEMERLVPIADRLVIDARKSLRRAEEIRSISETIPTHKPTEVQIPPGCARQHQDQLWY
jgi:hypothetical protein